MKKIIKLILAAILLVVTVVIISNSIITSSAKNKTFTEVNDIPKNKVGLVLGTSKYLSNGIVNLYYTYRIEAAAELFRAGKIDFVLASGDNLTSPDELATFKKDLISKGIPANKIYLDYAGFRTLDSVVRAKEIFGQEAYTIISQKFHNERAIYLAEKYNIKAIAFNAKDVSTLYGRKTSIREYFARTKAVLDILIGTKPKYLGKPIEIK